MVFTLPIQPAQARVELGPVTASMASLTVLGWCTRGKLRWLSPVALLAGFWGFYRFPIEKSDPQIDWLFPYYFCSALLLGYLLALVPPQDPVRKALLQRVRKLLGWEVVWTLVPLIWPLILLYLVFRSPRRS